MVSRCILKVSAWSLHCILCNWRGCKAVGPGVLVSISIQLLFLATSLATLQVVSLIGRKKSLCKLSTSKVQLFPHTYKVTSSLWSHVRAIAQDKLCNGSEMCSGSVQWKSTMEMKCDLSMSFHRYINPNWSERWSHRRQHKYQSVVGVVKSGSAFVYYSWLPTWGRHCNNNQCHCEGLDLVYAS